MKQCNCGYSKHIHYIADKVDNSPETSKESVCDKAREILSSSVNMYMLNEERDVFYALIENNERCEAELFSLQKAYTDTLNSLDDVKGQLDAALTRAALTRAELAEGVAKRSMKLIDKLAKQIR